MGALSCIPRRCGQEVYGKVHKTLTAFSEKGAIEMQGSAGLGASHGAFGLSFHSRHKGRGPETSPHPTLPTYSLLKERTKGSESAHKNPSNIHLQASSPS